MAVTPAIRVRRRGAVDVRLLDCAFMTPEMRWAAIAAGFVLAFGVLAHSLTPRYDWQLSTDGTAVVIYDRWSGKFQRAVYDKDGQMSLQKVITPF
jgi:hypothetical protein